MVTCNKLFLLLAKLNRCIDDKNFLKSPQFFFFLSFFFFSLEEFFELTFFRSPSFTRFLLPFFLFQWHDTLLNFSLNRGNSVPPLSPLFFLTPPPLLLLDFFTLLSRCFSLSPIHPASLSRNPLSHSLPPLLLLLLPSRQSNLIKVYPCSVSALSVSHQPRLFFYLRSSLRRSLLASPG